MLTFQFDRYGGGFVIALAEAPIGDVVTTWGKRIPPNELTAYQINPPARKRLAPRVDVRTTDGWFRYDVGVAPEQVAAEVAGYLEQIEQWFAGNKQQPNIR